MVMVHTRAIEQYLYLDALGIDYYRSRVQLAGAAPSQHVPLPRTDSPSPPLTPAPVPPSSSGERRLPARARGAAVRFSIAAVVSGPFLWLEELPQEVLGRDQVALIRAMSRALGAESDDGRVSQFDWPPHNNPQLDLGEEAARAALGSFIQRQLDEQGCACLILMGAACQARLEDFAAAPRTVRTAGTLEMLARPAIKARVWQDLRVLRQHCR